MYMYMYFLCVCIGSVCASDADILGGPLLDMWLGFIHTHVSLKQCNSESW